MFKYMPQNKQRTTVALMGVYIVVVVLVGLVTAYAATNHNLADAIHLASSQLPESYTELYFTHPGQLPVYAAPGKRQSVEFHIQNQSSSDLVSHYVITVSGSGGYSVSEGKVYLHAGEGLTVPFNFVIPRSGEQVTITIKLAGAQDQLVLRSHS